MTFLRCRCRFIAQDWWSGKRVQIFTQQVGSKSDDVNTIWEEDRVGWDGNDPFGNARHKYMITEDSEPANFGASLGWLLQLDGDLRRNAYLNSPWVKAVIPIRPGMEYEALEWLSVIEGNEDLDKFRPAIEKLITEIDATYKNETEHPSVVDPYFEYGFDPMLGGFKINSKDFEIFDSWTVILPTDQIVAVEFKL